MPSYIEHQMPTLKKCRAGIVKWYLYYDDRVLFYTTLPNANDGDFETSRVTG